MARAAGPAVAVAALLALGMTACSTGDDGDQLTEDERAAVVERATLTADDLGDAWHPGPGAQRSDGSADLTACLGGERLEADATNEGPAATFTTATDIRRFAQLAVRTVVTSESAIGGLFDAAGSDEAERCITALSEGATPTGATFDPDGLQTAPIAVPDGSRAVRVDLPFRTELTTTASGAATSSSDETLDGTMSAVFVARGQVLSVVLVLDVGGAVADGEIERWVAALAERQET